VVKKSLLKLIESIAYLETSVIILYLHAHICTYEGCRKIGDILISTSFCIFKGGFVYRTPTINCSKEEIALLSVSLHPFTRFFYKKKCFAAQEQTYFSNF
jgi:hypothetical protein